MKIAVPTRENHVDDHFGHCQYYTIFTIGDDKKVTKTEVLPSPQGCGCKSEIASTLREIGVEVLLAGNMGQGAVNKINGEGIQVVRGCSGKVDELVASWLTGFISDSGKTCDHNHDQGAAHQCQNH